MPNAFTCPFTNQEIPGHLIRFTDRDKIRGWYYPVSIGGEEKYFVYCQSFFDLISRTHLSDIQEEFKIIRPAIFYEFINNNLYKFGGTLMHWDCENVKGKPGNIILRDLLEIIKTDNSYPKSRKQKTNNLLFYIKKNLNHEGGELKISDDPIFWGNLFFLDFAEMDYHLKELHRKNLLIYNEQKSTLQLTFDGLDYIDNILEPNTGADVSSNYQPTDKFNEREKEIVKEKIDEFGNRLKRLEVGQQITYDDLMAELAELKKLLNVLGKKDWRQTLKGKLVDAGFGKLADQVLALIITTFQDDKLLNGK